jgi:TrmH family RNA methyltransferase
MPQAKIVTSAANPLLKEIRRAAAHGGRTRDGYCIAETRHLVEEAFRSGCAVGAVVAAGSQRDLTEALVPEGAAPLTLVPDAVFRSLATTEAPQGILALVKPPEWSAGDLFAGNALIIVLDGVQDPGNAGAIVRAAEAFGASGAVFVKGSASPHNPKAIRASAGSVFRLPLLAGIELEAARRLVLERGIRIYVTVPGARDDAAQADLRRACAIVIGSEGRGVSVEWLENSAALRIPTRTVESLNAAMAAGIVLYEAARQRKLE